MNPHAGIAEAYAELLAEIGVPQHVMEVDVKTMQQFFGVDWALPLREWATAEELATARRQLAWIEAELAE